RGCGGGKQESLGVGTGPAARAQDLRAHRRGWDPPGWGPRARSRQLSFLHTSTGGLGNLSIHSLLAFDEGVGIVPLVVGLQLHQSRTGGGTKKQGVTLIHLA